MPLRAPTPQELQQLQSEGVDVAKLPPELDFPEEQMGTGEAVAKSLRGRAGGLAGAGAGALLSQELPIAHVAPPWSELAAGAVGSLIGGFGGQKLQQQVTPEDWQREAAIAEQQHPYITGGANLVTGALLSGGKFAPGNILRAGRSLLANKAVLSAADEAAMSQIGPEALSAAGRNTIVKQAQQEMDKRALGNVAFGALTQPAINTGITLATEHRLPTGKEFGESVATGALFNEPNFLGRLASRQGTFNNEPIAHPAQEPTEKGGYTGEPKEMSNVSVPSPYNQRDQAGKYTIDNTAIRSAYKELNPKPDTSGMTPEESMAAESKWRQQSKISISEMRSTLHDQYIAKQQPNEVAPKVTIPTAEVTSKTQPEVTKSIITPEQAKLPTSQEALQSTAQAIGEMKPLEQMGFKEQTNPQLKKQGFWNYSDEGIKASIQDSPEKISLVGLYATTPGGGNGGKILERLKAIGKPIETVPKADNSELQPRLEAFYARHGFEDTGKDGVWRYDPSGMFHMEGEEVRMREGQPIPSESGIRTDYPTISSFLKAVGSGRHPLGDTANVIHGLLDEATKKTQIIPDATVPGGRYRFSTDKNGIKTSEILINPEHIGNIPLVMHEIAHAATISKMPQELLDLKGHALGEWMRNYLQYGKNEPLKEIIKCFHEAAKQMNIETELFQLHVKGGKSDEFGVAGNPLKAEKTMGIPHGYYFSDVPEFIAGIFDNRGFASLLNNLKSGLNDNKSLWSRLLDAIKKWVGYDIKKGSLLERVVKPIEELTGQQQPMRDRFGSPVERGSAPITQDDNAINVGKRFTSQFWRSTLDKIRQVNHPFANHLADAGQRMLDERQQLLGHWLNPILQLKDKITTTGDKRLEAAARYELENKKDGSHLLQTNAERQAFALEKKFLQENYNYRVANKEPVMRNGVLTMPQRDEFYHPTTPNPKIIEDYKNGRNIPQHDKTFLDYQFKLGKSSDQAQEALAHWKSSVQGSIGTSGYNNMQEFQAARKAQATPLPPEFTRQGFMTNIETYAHRMLTDNTFFKHIENNPDIMASLGETKGPWGMPLNVQHDNIAGNTSVKAFLGEMKGEVQGAGEHNEKALSSLATGMIVGPGTEVHKLISNQVPAIQIADNPYQLSRYLGSAVMNFREGIEHAIENGVIKFNARRLSDTLDSNVAGADRLRAVSALIKKAYTLNGLTEEFSAGLMQAGYEGILPMKIAKANGGDVTAQKFLKQLDPDYAIGRQYNKQEVSQLASKVINSIQGTGDARTMPPWMLKDSEISGFFRLSHWSVSQTNRFFKQVYEPALRGDYAPLVNSIFGAAVGGYIIKDLRERLQGKKSQIPSLSEIAASDRGLSGNLPLLGYEMIAASTYSGVGGMLSMMAKLPFDIAYKNKPQGMIFPLDEIAGDTLSTLSQASTAIANDPNLSWGTLGIQVANHIFSSNFQLGRVVMNQAINNGLLTGTVANKKLLADKLNQLRHFDMVQGTPYNELDAAGNQFMNLEQKRFKLEQDPAKAVAMVPQLMNNIMRAYSKDPDVMMSKLKALKQNEYQTFPSLESMPLQFMHYLSYLGRLKSPAEAQSELLDYVTHETVNKAKSSVIP